MNASHDDGIGSQVTQYMNAIGELELLTASEELELGARVQSGDEAAKQELIKRNLRLVVSIARKHCQHNRMENFMELIQEGNMGLITAADKYDPSFGTRFSTYATYWIRQSIFRHLKRDRTIRIPESQWDRVLEKNKVKSRLHADLGRDPLPEEVAAEMGMTLDKIHELISYDQEPLSLDVMRNAEETDMESSLYSVLADMQHMMNEEAIDAMTIADKLRGYIDLLPPRERIVINRRFGIDVEFPQTLGQIGDILNISRERVRQLELRAVERLQEFLIPYAKRKKHIGNKAMGYQRS